MSCGQPGSAGTERARFMRGLRTYISYNLNIYIYIYICIYIWHTLFIGWANNHFSSLRFKRSLNIQRISHSHFKCCSLFPLCSFECRSSKWLLAHPMNSVCHMYMYIYIYIYISCMYIYIWYIYIYIHIHIWYIYIYIYISIVQYPMNAAPRVWHVRSLTHHSHDSGGATCLTLLV